MKAPPKFPLWPQDWQTLRSSTLVRAVGGGVIGAQSLAGSIAQDNHRGKWFDTDSYCFNHMHAL